jgi:hypothetical protein
MSCTRQIGQLKVLREQNDEGQLQHRYMGNYILCQVYNCHSPPALCS